MVWRIFILFFIYFNKLLINGFAPPGTRPDIFEQSVRYPQEPRPVISKDGSSNVPRSPYEPPTAIHATRPPLPGYYQSTKPFTRGPFPFVPVTESPIKINLQNPQSLLEELNNKFYYGDNKENDKNNKIVSNTGIFYPIQKSSNGDMIGYVNVPYYEIPVTQTVKSQEVTILDTTTITTTTTRKLTTSMTTTKRTTTTATINSRTTSKRKIVPEVSKSIGNKVVTTSYFNPISSTTNGYPVIDISNPSIPSVKMVTIPNRNKFTHKNTVFNYLNKYSSNPANNYGYAAVPISPNIYDNNNIKYGDNNKIIQPSPPMTGGYYGPVSNVNKKKEEYMTPYFTKTRQHLVTINPKIEETLSSIASKVKSKPSTTGSYNTLPEVMTKSPPKYTTRAKSIPKISTHRPWWEISPTDKKLITQTNEYSQKSTSKLITRPPTFISSTTKKEKITLSTIKENQLYSLPPLETKEKIPLTIATKTPNIYTFEKTTQRSKLPQFPETYQTLSTIKSTKKVDQSMTFGENKKLDKEKIKNIKSEEEDNGFPSSSTMRSLSTKEFVTFKKKGSNFATKSMVDVTTKIPEITEEEIFEIIPKVDGKGQVEKVDKMTTMPEFKTFKPSLIFTTKPPITMKKFEKNSKRPEVFEKVTYKPEVTFETIAPMVIDRFKTTKSEIAIFETKTTTQMPNVSFETKAPIIIDRSQATRGETVTFEKETTTQVPNVSFETKAPIIIDRSQVTKGEIVTFEKETTTQVPNVFFETKAPIIIDRSQTTKGEIAVFEKETTTRIPNVSFETKAPIIIDRSQTTKGEIVIFENKTTSKITTQKPIVSLGTKIPVTSNRFPTTEGVTAIIEKETTTHVPKISFETIAPVTIDRFQTSKGVTAVFEEETTTQRPEILFETKTPIIIDGFQTTNEETAVFEEKTTTQSPQIFFKTTEPDVVFETGTPVKTNNLHQTTEEIATFDLDHEVTREGFEEEMTTVDMPKLKFRTSTYRPRVIQTTIKEATEVVPSRILTNEPTEAGKIETTITNAETPEVTVVKTLETTRTPITTKAFETTSNMFEEETFETVPFVKHNPKTTTLTIPQKHSESLLPEQESSEETVLSSTRTPELIPTTESLETTSQIFIEASTHAIATTIKEMLATSQGEDVDEIPFSPSEGVFSTSESPEGTTIGRVVVDGETSMETKSLKELCNTTEVTTLNEEEIFPTTEIIGNTHKSTQPIEELFPTEASISSTISSMENEKPFWIDRHSTTEGETIIPTNSVFTTENSTFIPSTEEETTIKNTSIPESSTIFIPTIEISTMETIDGNIFTSEGLAIPSSTIKIPGEENITTEEEGTPTTEKSEIAKELSTSEEEVPFSTETIFVPESSTIKSTEESSFIPESSTILTSTNETTDEGEPLSTKTIFIPESSTIKVNETSTNKEEIPFSTETIFESSTKMTEEEIYPTTIFSLSTEEEEIFPTTETSILAPSTKHSIETSTIKIILETIPFFDVNPSTTEGKFLEETHSTIHLTSLFSPKLQTTSQTITSIEEELTTSSIIETPTKLIKSLTIIKDKKKLPIITIPEIEGVEFISPNMTITKILDKNTKNFVPNDGGVGIKKNLIPIQVVTDIEKSIEMNENDFEKSLDKELDKMIPKILETLENDEKKDKLLGEELEKEVGKELEEVIKNNDTMLTSNEDIFNKNIEKTFLDRDYPDFNPPKDKVTDINGIINNENDDIKETTIEPCPYEPFIKDEPPSDVMFLIDGTKSMSSENFMRSLKMMGDIIMKFDNVGNNGTQFSLVQYTSQPFFEFSFKKHECRGDILKDIIETSFMKSDNETNNLDVVLNKVNKFGFSYHRGDRPEAKNFLIIFNGDDGVNENVNDSLNNMIKNDIDVYAICEDEESQDVFKDSIISKNIMSLNDGNIIAEKISNDIKKISKSKSNEEIQIVKIDCNDNELSVVIEVPKDFQGIFSTKDNLMNTNCSRKVPLEIGNGYKQIGFSFKDNDCGLSIIKNEELDGKNFSIIMNILKDEKIVTSLDKSYLVQCFLPNKDLMSVVKGEEKEIISDSIPIEVVPPTCEYSLHRDSINGPTVNLAVLGQTIYHKWECKGIEGIEKYYDMFIHNCFIGSHNKKNLINMVNEDGCVVGNSSIDKINYDSNKMIAYAKSRVISIDDIEHMKFSCKIGLCLKENEYCEGITPPQCDEEELSVTRHHRQTNTFNQALEENVETLLQIIKSFKFGAQRLIDKRNTFNYKDFEGPFISIMLILLITSLSVFIIITIYKKYKNPRFYDENISFSRASSIYSTKSCNMSVGMKIKMDSINFEDSDIFNRSLNEKYKGKKFEVDV
uniref:Chitin-binding type-2 domain-containing protein n=1 Tax=Parastrongyloides trichosuri TaxID=131310 RepID=A0A0N5A1J5_PARTI